MRLILVIVALASVLGSCSASGEYLTGDELYEQSCAACHGGDGGGGIGPAIGRGTVADVNLSDDQISGVITVGPGNMPGFSRFTPEQVDSLVAYVRSFAGR